MYSFPIGSALEVVPYGVWMGWDEMSFLLVWCIRDKQYKGNCIRLYLAFIDAAYIFDIAFYPRFFEEK